MADSEHGIYLSIKHAYDIARRLNLTLNWNTSGWKVFEGKAKTSKGKSRTPLTSIVRGDTVNELHHYFNGYCDGLTREKE